MNRPAGFECRLIVRGASSAREFVAYGTTVPPGWPDRPGAVLRAADGTAEVLFVAPSRWLLPAATALATASAAVVAALGSLVDVTGKWVEMRLVGPEASRALASTVDVASLLAGRACAAVRLFDCPAILLREPEGYVLWVQASYATAFAALPFWGAVVSDA
jgi:heterotetrameric sarcosine oxidase gamma subunit